MDVLSSSDLQNFQQSLIQEVQKLGFMTDESQRGYQQLMTFVLDRDIASDLKETPAIRVDKSLALWFKKYAEEHNLKGCFIVIEPLGTYVESATNVHFFHLPIQISPPSELQMDTEPRYYNPAGLNFECLKKDIELVKTEMERLRGINIKG